MLQCPFLFMYFCVYVYFYRIDSKIFMIFGLSPRFYSLRLLLVSLNFSILLCPSIVYLKSHLGHWSSLLDMWVYLGVRTEDIQKGGGLFMLLTFDTFDFAC